MFPPGYLLRVPGGRSAPALIAILGVVILLSLPPVAVAHKVYFRVSAPYPGASPVVGLQNPRSHCSGSYAVLSQPSFNLTTGVARGESKATARNCTLSGYLDVGMYFRVTVNFSVPASGVYNISEKWQVSTAFVYKIVNATANGSQSELFMVREIVSIYDRTGGFHLNLHQGGPYSGANVFTGSGTIPLNWTATDQQRDPLIGGHKYSVETTLGVWAELRTGNDPGATVSGTLDLHTGSYGGSLLFVKVGQ